MMKLDVTQALAELDGTLLRTSPQPCPMCRQPVGTSETMTLRLALTRALSYRGPSEQIEFSVQMERYELARRVQAEDVLELSIEEAVSLKALVATIYGPLITGQVGLLIKEVS